MAVGPMAVGPVAVGPVAPATTPIGADGAAAGPATVGAWAAGPNPGGGVWGWSSVVGTSAADAAGLVGGWAG